MAQVYIDGIGWVDDGGALGPPGGYTPDQQAAISAGYDPSYAGGIGVPNATSPMGYLGPAYAPQVNPSAEQARIISQNTTANNGIFDDLSGAQGRFFDYQNGLGASSVGLGNSARDTANWLGGQNQQGIEQSWNSTNWANGQDQQSLGQYTGALGAVTNWDLGNYGQLSGDLGQARDTSLGAYNTLQQQAGGFSQLQARGYGADVVSQAQYAQADPASIQAQYQALGQLQGAASGSLNVTSQAAQAYANDQDIQNQARAADALQGIAGGSKDVNFWELPGINDLYAASQGSKDIHVGQEDPEAYAAQQSALAQFGALTNPEVTAQEKFIYEQARNKQEQDERANREAVMTNLRQRGMSGSGAEIGGTALANQQTSENRLLNDLGAQSTAVQRAMAALQGYGGLSSTMVNEGDQVAAQNQSAQLNALGQFTGLGANVGEFNSNLEAQAQEAASQAYATLRAQGFSEAYARGQAADIVNSANSDRELNAMNMSGNLASNMRQESFTEDFSRKSAADNMSQFNKAQSQITQRFQDQYAADQQNAAWGRDTDVATAGQDTARTLSGIANTRFQGANTIGQNFATNSNNLFNAQTGVTAAANNRNQGSIGLAGQLNASTAQGQLGADNLQIGINGQLSTTAAQQLDALTRLGLGRIGNNTTSTGLATGAIQNQAGSAAAAAATAEAKRQYDEDPGGLLGTGLLGRNGILGIKGVPLL